MLCYLTHTLTLLLHLQGVVAEADDDDYWFHASRDGNREKHYRWAVSGVMLSPSGVYL